MFRKKAEKICYSNPNNKPHQTVKTPDCPQTIPRKAAKPPKIRKAETKMRVDSSATKHRNRQPMRLLRGSTKRRAEDEGEPNRSCVSTTKYKS